jgi:hypothetical protein
MEPSDELRKAYNTVISIVFGEEIERLKEFIYAHKVGHLGSTFNDHLYGQQDFITDLPTMLTKYSEAHLIEIADSLSALNEGDDEDDEEILETIVESMREKLLDI